MAPGDCLDDVNGCEETHLDYGWDHSLGQGIPGCMKQRKQTVLACIYLFLDYGFYMTNCSQFLLPALPAMMDRTPNCEPKQTPDPLSCFCHSCLCLFETGSYCAALVDLELAEMLLALPLLSAGIKGVSHHARHVRGVCHSNRKRNEDTRDCTMQGFLTLVPLGVQKQRAQFHCCHGCHFPKTY